MKGLISITHDEAALAEFIANHGGATLDADIDAIVNTLSFRAYDECEPGIRVTIPRDVLSTGAYEIFTKIVDRGFGVNLGYQTVVIKVEVLRPTLAELTRKAWITSANTPPENLDGDLAKYLGQADLVDRVDLK